MGAPPAERSQHTAKTRYRQADAACTLSRVHHGEMRVDFAAPQWAVRAAPRQANRIRAAAKGRVA